MSLKNLIEDIRKKPVFILSIGVRKSGKSYNTLALIEDAMARNTFGYYILCLPVFDFEQTDSYDFIKKYQKSNPKKIAVYDRYTFSITDKILQNASKLGNCKSRTLIFIDDAMISKSSIFDSNFYGLLSIIRHLGISLMLNFHSLTSGKVLSPFVRQNIDYLCLYKVVSENLLQMVFEEYLSLSEIGDWKQFRVTYMQQVNSGDFKSILLDARTGKVDWDLKELTQHLGDAPTSKKAVVCKKNCCLRCFQKVKSATTGAR